MSSIKKQKKVQERRKRRVRYSLHGTDSRPRLSVFRSSKYMYVQAINDDAGRTLAEASGLGKDLKDTFSGLNKTDAAREVGKAIGRKLLSQNITEVIFDRGQYLYHGRVKALADGAREAGLKF